MHLMKKNALLSFLRANYDKFFEKYGAFRRKRSFFSQKEPEISSFSLVLFLSTVRKFCKINLKFGFLILLALVTGGCNKSNKPAPVVYKGDSISVPAKTEIKDSPTLSEVDELTTTDKISVPQMEEVDVSEELLADQYLTHRVKEGETLPIIARQYNVENAVIIRVNNLHPPYRLQVDSKLRIPLEGKSRKPSLMVEDVSVSPLLENPSGRSEAAVLLPEESKFLKRPSHQPFVKTLKPAEPQETTIVTGK